MQDEPKASAVIIPFPRRQQPRVVPAPAPAAIKVVVPVNPAPSEIARLANVMAELDNALTRQSAAVATWRSAILDLRVAMDGLDASLRDYHDQLDLPGPGLSNRKH